MPAIWNMATAAGASVRVLGFWATYPAEPVQRPAWSRTGCSRSSTATSAAAGVGLPAVATGWARERLRTAQAASTSPRCTVPAVAGRGRVRDAAASADPYAHPVSALRRILVETAVYDALCRDWSSRELSPDLPIVYLQGTDSIGHVFAPLRAAAPAAASTPTTIARYSGVPGALLRAHRRLLGEYRQLAEAHGARADARLRSRFRWQEGGRTQLSSAQRHRREWHREEGIYLLWGHGVQAGNGAARQRAAGLRDAARPARPAARQRPAGALARGKGVTGAGRRRAAVDYRRGFTPAPRRAPSAPPRARGTRRWRHCARSATSPVTPAAAARPP